MIRPHRSHPLWFAFLLHRLSGVALALFLPLHFYVLSLALTNAAALNSFLSLTELPAVKAAETLLVLMLAVHLFGGLRLMAMEWLPWTNRQKTLAAASVALGTAVAGLFLMKVI